MDRLALIIANIAVPVAVVLGAIVIMVFFLGASGAGAVFGVVLGCFAIGGLLGWALNRLLRIPYPWADVVALTVLVGITGFTNTPAGGSMVITWIVYTAGAIAAFCLLVLYHRARPKGGKPDKTGSQPLS